MAECRCCGRRTAVPHACPSCGSRYIRQFGIGTEKVEEMAKIAFPDRTVGRLDLDTARRKGESEKILSAFRRGKTDILVGTQLVAKGLDFQNVGVVGIISARCDDEYPGLSVFRAHISADYSGRRKGRPGDGDRRSSHSDLFP